MGERKEKQTLYECFDEKSKTKTLNHPYVLNLTLNLYSSYPKEEEEVEWMNVLNFVQFFRNLSLCDKARVAFNQPQVKGMAGSPSERMTEYAEEIDEHLFFSMFAQLY